MTEMNEDDYAILVGIDRYPELGKGDSQADLQGPLNDVAAVKNWLIDLHGGGLPADNVFELGLVDRYDKAPGRPNFSDVNRLLDAIHRKARHAGRAQFGRRIYIYMSGHGFSPARSRACLYTADARLESGQNVHATGWLDWLQDSGFFREYVLWVDACMDRQYFFPPGEPSLKPINVNVAPLSSFVGFAAQRPLKAIEHPISEDGGKFHGAFTWALLVGLRGAAADVHGRVTGRSLADWVRNAMCARYELRDWQDRDVAKEPEIIAEDTKLIFARGAVQPDFEVTLKFPAVAVGARARIWSGSPPAILRTFMVDALEQALLLRPGLYLLETEIGGLRHGFEVLRPGPIEVSNQGFPVNEQPADMLTLDIDPENEFAEIFVIDGRFALVDFRSGRMSTQLPPGLFKVKIRIANAITEEVFLLDRDRGKADVPRPAELPSTVIPLADTAATHESHQQAREDAVSAASVMPMSAGKAVLMLMVRTFSSRANPVQNTTPPWHGLRIVNASGQVVLDMEQRDSGACTEGPDGMAYASVVVDPGCYYLRQRFDPPSMPFGEERPVVANGPSFPIEQSVIACAGWRTEVYVLRRVAPGAREVDGRPRISFTMRRHDEPMTVGTQTEDRYAEMAKLALARERRVLNDELECSLMLKSRNPIAAIIGGHLLLVEQERDPGRDMSMLKMAVVNLRGLLGDSHPDVEALALNCRHVQPGRAIVGPPMFQRSWAMLAKAAHNRPDLIPASMWARVQASTGLPPFMAWTTDVAVKASAAQHLARIVFGKKAKKVRDAEPAAGALTSLPSSAGADISEAMLMPMFTLSLGTARRAPSARAFDSAPRAARRRAIAMNLPPSAFEILGDISS